MYTTLWMEGQYGPEGLLPSGQLTLGQGSANHVTSGIVNLGETAVQEQQSMEAKCTMAASPTPVWDIKLCVLRAFRVQIRPLTASRPVTYVSHHTDPNEPW